MLGASIQYLSRRKFGIAILLVLVSSALLKLYYATAYVTYTDEILSATVAKSISQTWLPILPSNSYYPRALLHHYLLSIPISLGGIDYLPMRINSILFSLITVFAIYLLGKLVSNRLVAISAAVILSISSLFNQFALSGRMYMTYGTFYILCLYFFYRGFIKGESRSKWLAIIFMSATILSSEAGFLVGLVLFFILIIYHNIIFLKDKAIYFGVGIWFLLVWFVMVYDIPGSYQPFTAHSGAPDPSIINTQMPLREIIGNLIYPWRALDRVLPFSMPFFLMMTFGVIKRGELRRHYPLVVLLPALLMESFFTYRVQYRIIIALIPLYILACCQYINTFLIWANEMICTSREGSSRQLIVKNSRILSLRKAKPAIIITAIFLLLTTGLVYANKSNSMPALRTYIFQAFGYHDSKEKENLEPAYNYLRSHIGAKDTIIVTTVEYGLFFLGFDYNYYYLRQKKTGDEKSEIFISFDKEREPYYGKPIIDSIEKLQYLMKTSENTIWVVEDFKIDSSVGREVREFIDEKFELAFDDYPNNSTKVYRRISNIQ